MATTPSSLSLTEAGRSSEVERSLMVRWVVGSILHGVDPLNYFSFQPVLHDWCSKGHGVCYPDCGIVYVKVLLLLIGKSSLCSGSRRFPLSLSEWSFTMRFTPYNHKIKCVESSNKTYPSFIPSDKQVSSLIISLVCIHMFSVIQFHFIYKHFKNKNNNNLKLKKRFMILN